MTLIPLIAFIVLSMGAVVGGFLGYLNTYVTGLHDFKYERLEVSAKQERCAMFLHALNLVAAMIPPVERRKGPM